jgi:hypothetical protein
VDRHEDEAGRLSIFGSAYDHARRIPPRHPVAGEKFAAAAAKRTEAHSFARRGAINELVIALPEPAPIASAGEHVRRRFIDFFTAHVITLRRERVVGAGLLRLGQIQG